MALTLRTSPSLDEHLNILKDSLNMGTSSGVIKFVVENYNNVDRNLQKTRKELAETKLQFDKLIDILNKKKAIEKELSIFLNGII